MSRPSSPRQESLRRLAAWLAAPAWIALLLYLTRDMPPGKPYAGTLVFGVVAPLVVLAFLLGRERPLRDAEPDADYRPRRIAKGPSEVRLRHTRPLLTSTSTGALLFKLLVLAVLGVPLYWILDAFGAPAWILLGIVVVAVVLRSRATSVATVDD